MQSGALTVSEFVQWSMDHVNLSLQLANILFEVIFITYVVYFAPLNLWICKQWWSLGMSLLTFSGVAKDGSGRTQALPMFYCKRSNTLIKQSNVLLKQSLSQVVPYQLIESGYTTVQRMLYFGILYITYCVNYLLI